MTKRVNVLGVGISVLNLQSALTAIAAAVRELRTDRGLAEKLGRGAVAFADRHFSWRRSAEALANFHLSLAPS